MADKRVSRDSRVGDLVHAGEIKFGLFPPQYYKDARTGRLKGLWVEVARELAAQVGVKAVLMEFPSPLAVTSEARAAILPDAPAVGEFVPGFEASNWFGLVAPKNTAPDIIDKLNKLINEGLADPQVSARLMDLGGTVVANSAAEFGKRIAADADKWANVIRTA